jgi:hypothetical protein
MDKRPSLQPNDTSQRSQPTRQANTQAKLKIHNDQMRFGSKVVSKRKVAFIAALFVNAIITFAQQTFMLQMFYN